MKEEILNKIKNADEIEGQNSMGPSMGPSESWYNEYYMVREFAKEKELNLENLSVEELNNLLLLAEFAGGIFY